MRQRLPDRFPNLDFMEESNPAISLFGNRFYNGQSLLEFATEFLGIVYSKKRLGSQTFESPFIDFNQRTAMVHHRLSYNLPVKLNLKLFGLFASSRVDTRHQIHENQYKKLVQRLTTKIKSDAESSEQVVVQLETLFRGLVGAGFNRDWCAKSFFPLTMGLITRETIWGASKAKGVNLTWQDSLLEMKKYYTWQKRNFMARGGELLYLQICNAFTCEENDVFRFLQSNGIIVECNSNEQLYISIVDGFHKMQNILLNPFERLIDFVENLDPESSVISNEKADWQTCEWCPQESWREGYLFAVELNRLLHATLDPVDRLEMVVIGCGLQVLRSLCAQSVRYAGNFAEAGTGGALGYAWVFSHPNSPERGPKVISQRNLLAVQSLIQKAIRHEALAQNAAKGPKNLEVYYKEADSKYGHKLFLSLGKKLGIIVPLKGKGARFILTDKIVRYLVLTMLLPGEKCTYDEFLKRIYSHFGMAVGGEQFTDATIWSGLPERSSTHSLSFSWFREMLRAGGFLTDLSDGCPIVENPFGKGE